MKPPSEPVAPSEPIHLRHLEKWGADETPSDFTEWLEGLLFGQTIDGTPDDLGAELWRANMNYGRDVHVARFSGAFCDYVAEYEDNPDRENDSRPVSVAVFRVATEATPSPLKALIEGRPLIYWQVRPNVELASGCLFHSERELGMAAKSA